MNLDQRFERLTLLDLGGRCEIWRVRDRERPAADLLLKLVTVADAESLAVEFSLTRGIHHPNLTRLLEFGRDGERVWLLREFVPGTTLTAAAPTLDAAARRRVFIDVLRGLVALHRRAVVHLDVKPDNILLRADDQAAVLTDFGLARVHSREPRSANACGTPPFIAPEVLMGLPADPRADLFSLAVTMLAVGGRVPPIEADRLYRWFPQTAFTDAIGLRREDLDAELADVLWRMLALDPGDRPRSAIHVLRDLGADCDEHDAVGLLATLHPRPALPEAVLDALRTLTGPKPGPVNVVVRIPPSTPTAELLETARFMATRAGLRVLGDEAVLAASASVRPIGTDELVDPAADVAARVQHARRLLAAGDDCLILIDAKAHPHLLGVAGAALRMRRDRDLGPRLLVAIDADDPAATPDLNLGPDSTTLHLQPLDQEAVARHLAELDGTPDEVATAHHRELAAAMLDIAGPRADRIAMVLRDAIDHHHARWQHGRLALDLLRPEHLHRSVGIDHPAGDLDPDERRLLALIALWGGSTPVAVWLTAAGALAVTAAASLIDRGVIARQQDRFVATSPALARAALDGIARGDAAKLAQASLEHAAAQLLPPLQRALLLELAGRHAAARSLLHPRAAPDERCDPVSLALLAELVAQDADCACDVALARVDRWSHSGELERAAEALDQQLAHAALPRARRPELLICRGEIDLHRSRLDAAERLLQQARQDINQAPTAERDRLRCRAVRGLASLRLLRGDPHGAARQAYSSLRSWRGARGLHHRWLAILHATFTARAGAIAKARDLLLADVAWLRSDGAAAPLRDHLLAIALGNLGPILLQGGDAAAALAALDEARAFRVRDRRLLEEASVLNNTSIVRRELADLEGAVEAARDAARLYGWCADPLGEAAARANLGDCLRRTGQFAEADRELMAAWSATHDRRLPRERILIGCRLARLRLAAGQTAAATELGADLTQHAPADLPDRVRAELTLLAGEIAAAHQDWDVALRQGRSALAGFLRAEDQPSVAVAELRLGEWSLEVDLPDRAAEHFARCRPTPLLTPVLQLLEGQLSARRSAREEAFALLLKARDGARQIGLPEVRARAATALAHLLADLDPARAAAFAAETEATLATVDFGSARTIDASARRHILLGKRLAEDAIAHPPGQGAAGLNDIPGRGIAGPSTQTTFHGDMIPLEVFRSIAAMCRSLSQERDLGRLLEMLLDHAIAITGARRGFLLLRRDGSLVAETMRGSTTDDRSPFSRSIAMDAIRQRRPVVTANANNDERFLERRSIQDLDLRSVLCAPFESDGGLVGVVYVDNPVREGIFSPRSVDYLEVVADQAAVAIGNLERSRRGDAQADHRALARVADAVRDRDEPSAVEPVGSTAVWRQTLELVDKVATSDLPLLILGESGTGKELIARTAHARSGQVDRPFVAVNVSAVPEALMEAEFFGYVKGAFTGANRDHDGYFVQAAGGTLFLDEIGEMPAAMQAKLLRTLQDGQVRPVGSIGATSCRVRLMCATHRDLAEMLAHGTFRQDLYFRLRGAVIHVPPLRERRDDAAVLAEHFLARWNEQHGTDKHMTPALLEQMRNYDWPGNVRELTNEVRRLCVMSTGDRIDGDLLRESPLREGRDAAGPLQLKPMKELEREAIEQALQACAGNREQAAKVLGIPRTTFYNKLKRLRIGHGNDPRPDPA